MVVADPQTFERMKEDARRDDWHLRFVGSDIRQLLGEIERLQAALPVEFERGKDIGKAIGWAQAKEDSAKIFAALGSVKNGDRT